jgi:hypothetical protein
MTNIPTRILQDNLRLQQIKIGRCTDPVMVSMHEQNIRDLAKELLRRWRIESARLTN